MSSHPLAVRLIERLRPRHDARVLEFASGSGRNAAALRGAGFAVVTVSDASAVSPAPFAGIADRFAAALSTHGLLHGTPAIIAARLQEIAALLEPSGLLYATFGSTRDARFGRGEQIDAATFAPLDGDERGVAHAFFDRDHLTALLAPDFAVESLEEHAVDDVAGRWAHQERSLERAVHWFVTATVTAGSDRRRAGRRR